MKLSRKQSPPARRSGNPSIRQERASSEDLSERYAFRRNRTLTGSLSPSVASANEHRSELKSSRIHAHDLRRHRRHLGGTLLAVLLLCAGLGFVIYQSIAAVAVTAVTDVPFEAREYERSIQEYLNGRLLERSRVTLNVEELGLYMQQNGHPEIGRVLPETAFADVGTTRISLIFRRPVVVWQSGASRMYVDDTGVAFTRNVYTEPNVKVVDESGISTEGNKVLASNRFLAFIGTTIGRMKANGYTVTQVALPAGTTRQIAVSVEGVDYPIKISVDRPVGEQAEDAARALRYLTARGITPEYVDVRISGKAYYK